MYFVASTVVGQMEQTQKHVSTWTKCQSTASPHPLLEDNAPIYRLNGTNLPGYIFYYQGLSDSNKWHGPLYSCGLRMRRECRERFPRHQQQ